MEPREDDKTPEPAREPEGRPQPAKKKKHFRVVKLEERIAPRVSPTQEQGSHLVGSIVGPVSSGF